MINQIEEEQDKKSQKDKLISFQMIPKQVWKPQNIFFLKGLPFIDLNLTNNESKLSNLNYFSSVSSSVVLREQGLFYKNIQSTQIIEYDSYQKVIFFMKKLNNLDVLQLAESLEGYEEFQKNNESIKNQIKFIALCSSQVRAQVAQKRQEFEKFREEKLLKIPKEKYIMFIDLTFNYAEMTQKPIGDGMNEAFIKLLGCDLQSMQNITMRKGSLSFIDKNSHLKIIKNLVKLSNKSPDEEFLPQKLNIQLTTLDDIEIDVEATIYTYFCDTAAAFKGYFHPQFLRYTYDRKTIICDFDIEDFHIRKINAIRERNRKEGLNVLENNFNITKKDVQQRKLQDRSASNSVTTLNNSDSQRMDSVTIDSIQQDKIMNTSSKIISISQSQDQNNIVDSLIYDVPYAVQSQDFIERFYDLERIQKANGTYVAPQQNNLKYCGFKMI